MPEATLRRMDALSQALLLLWVGMALGFLFLGPPTLQALGRLDGVAWAAFALALALSWGARWLGTSRKRMASVPCGSGAPPCWPPCSCVSPAPFS